MRLRSLAARSAAPFVFLGGLTHLYLYRSKGYRSIPRIGPMFLLNAVMAVAVALVLVVKPGRVAASAGLGLSLVTLAAFGLSRSASGLQGFYERGLEPSPWAVVTLIAEFGALVPLTIAAYAPVRPRSAVP
jgi:hypothetical protein